MCCTLSRLNCYVAIVNSIISIPAPSIMSILDQLSSLYSAPLRNLFPGVMVSRSLDSVVDNALACHHGDPGSNPGQGMWQGSGRPSRFGGFPRVLRFPPPRLTT